MRPSGPASTPHLLALTCALLFALAGCGPAGTLGGDGDGSGDGSGDEGKGDGVRPDAGSFGGEGDSCQSTGQCRGELVCDPSTNACSSSVACADHVDCSPGSYCDDAGQCARSGDTTPCAEDETCATGDECIGGYCGCQGEVFEAELVDVNMMILLDRSGSMARNLDGDQVNARCPDSRWCIAGEAIDALLGAYDDLIRFGFAVYPHSDVTSGTIGDCNQGQFTCTAGNVLEDLADPAAAAIRDAFNATSPYGCTPSGPSMTTVAAATSFDPNAENALLYVTDGGENCGSDQATAAAELLSQGVRTFVVGFSEDISFDELNATAEAGGTAREDADDGLKFYLATDAATLEEAFEAIAGEALACDYDLSGVPTEPENLHVYADQQSMLRDPSHANGWDYDPEDNRITVYGPACDDLRAGAVEELAIVQTCDVVVD
jgi:hypothetical protein